MPKELVVDTHDVDSHFLFQYQQSGRFKDWVKAHIQPAFGSVEAQLFSLLMDRDVDRAEGVQLQQWAKFYGINYSGLSDEQLRSAIYVAAATQFGTGSIYEAKAFFKNYFRANDVKIEEVFPCKLTVTVYDGISQPILNPWPPLPPGLAEVTVKFATGTDIIFSFAEDNDPKGAGYAMLQDPIPVSEHNFGYPTTGVSGAVITIAWELIDNFLDVAVEFKYPDPNFDNFLQAQMRLSPADEALGQGFIAFRDKAGDVWEFFGTPATQVSRFDDVTTLLCVLNNQVEVYARKNGISIPWVDVIANPFVSYMAGEAAIFTANNGSDKLTIGYQNDPNFTDTLLLKPGVGGRYTLLA